MRLRMNNLKKYIDPLLIIQDMQKILWDPQTLKALLDALSGLPKSEMYDLHEEECSQVYTMFQNLWKKPYAGNRDDNNDELWHEIRQLLQSKEKIESIFEQLLYAYQNYPAETYYMEESENKIFQQKMRVFFANLIKWLNIYKKELTLDDIAELSSRPENIIESLRLHKKLQDDEMAKLLTLLLQRHIYKWPETIDISLSYLMKIYGEDISHPLLWWNNNSKDKLWDSLLFMRYWFGQIEIPQLLYWIDKIITRNNEIIQNLIQEFIPVYHVLRSILEKTNEPAEIDSNLIITTDKQEKLEIKWSLDIKKIQKYSTENDHLRVLKHCDKTVLKKKLQKLRDICDLSEQGNVMLLV